ncbi:hypothetical protein, partial [Methanoregula sp.]|uniref:hypothetical protein n=1 Tax=Methanoregula sp. TaxID=2052170 RepID=UPI0025FCCBE6
MIGKALWFLLTILAIAMLATAGFFITQTFFPQERIITPAIQPVMAGQHPVPISHGFPFQKDPVAFTIWVNGSVLDGARDADKSVTVIGNISDNIWIAESYRAMVDDPAQEEIYRDLIGEFRTIRQGRALDDDEYLELMAVYVQSLRYETLEENPAKFPVETVADRAGDCDDKSLLLAGLLSREGYSVALLSFPEENHMAVGIGSDEYRSMDTNFTYLETTNISYVGAPPGRLIDGRVLKSHPLIIPIGQGEIFYTGGEQTRFIQEAAEHAESRAKDSEDVVRRMQEDLTARQEQIMELENRMQVHRLTGEVRQYNALVAPHNRMVADYNRDLEAYRQAYSRYEAYI